LAIVALLGGRFFNWIWLDPIMGIVGALFIAHWSRGLIVSAGAVLLDTVPSQNLVAAIRARLERGNDRVADLHLWRLGPGHSGLIVTIISEQPQPPAVYKEQLLGIDGLSHITVEVHHCQSPG
jgi:Co/Zn/Cd efflux system component